MSKFIRKEDGLAVVEATMLLPFCTIMIVALFYAAIFMCQKANLQANVQNTLIYYKNVDSDNYVEAKANMSYGDDNKAEGSSYGTPVYKFPYRFLSMPFDEDGFKSFFKSMCGHMFFDDGSNVEINVKPENYVIYKTITATATQTVKPAINLSMVGASNSLTITVTGTAVVTDGDDFMRNIDYVIDIVNQTSLGKKAQEIAQKGVDYYNDFKEKFGVNDSEEDS
jgi:Flp pilus assembly pilin Flp